MKKTISILALLLILLISGCSTQIKETDSKINNNLVCCMNYQLRYKNLAKFSFVEKDECQIPCKITIEGEKECAIGSEIYKLVPDNKCK